jgi:small subunit ribosomal protein S21
MRFSVVWGGHPLQPRPVIIPARPGLEAEGERVAARGGAWYTAGASGECERGEFRVTKVIVEPDESFENALKRFKKQCEKAGLMSELRKRQHYEKPSVKRKRKTLAARKKAKKRERFFD